MHALLPLIAIALLIIAAFFPRTGITCGTVLWLWNYLAIVVQPDVEDLPNMPGSGKIAKKYFYWLSSPPVATSVSRGLFTSLLLWLPVIVIAFIRLSWEWTAVAGFGGYLLMSGSRRTCPHMALRAGALSGGGSDAVAAFTLIDYGAALWKDAALLEVWWPEEVLAAWRRSRS